MPFTTRFVPLQQAIVPWEVIQSFPYAEPFANTISPVAFSLVAQFRAVSNLVLPDGFNAVAFDLATNTPVDFSLINAGASVYLTGRISDIGGGNWAIHGNTMDNGTQEIYALEGDSLGNFTATPTGLIVTHMVWLSSCGDDPVGGSTCSLMWDDIAGTVTAYVISPSTLAFYNAFEIPTSEFNDFQGGAQGLGSGFNMVSHDSGFDQFWWGTYQGNIACISWTREPYLGPTFTYATEVLDFETLGIIQAVPIGLDNNYAYYWKADTNQLIKIEIYRVPMWTGYAVATFPPEITDVIGAYFDINTSMEYIIYSDDGGVSYQIGLTQMDFGPIPGAPGNTVVGLDAVALPCFVNCIPLIDRRK